MVNNVDRTEPTAPAGLAVSKLGAASAVIWVYVALTVATVVALVIMSAVAPELASNEAWGHAVIVVVFAVLLPLRMRAARRGSVGALRAVAIIAGVLLLVNVVEGLIPNVFPVWMRVEMFVIAALMAVLLALVVPRLRRG